MLFLLNIHELDIINSWFIQNKIVLFNISARFKNMLYYERNEILRKAIILIDGLIAYKNMIEFRCEIKSVTPAMC